MSTTVKIPGNLNPWEATINGVQYGPYPAGSVQTVPDEIAALIVGNSTFDPVENPPETVEEMIRRIVREMTDEKLYEPMYLDVGSIDTDDEATITTRFSVDAFDKIIGSAKALPVTVRFGYGSLKTITSAYYRQGNVLFFIGLDGDATGILYFKVKKSGSAIKGQTFFVPFDET